MSNIKNLFDNLLYLIRSLFQKIYSFFYLTFQTLSNREPVHYPSILLCSPLHPRVFFKKPKKLIPSCLSFSFFPWSPTAALGPGISPGMEAIGRGGFGMPPSQHLIHEDKPRPSCRSVFPHSHPPLTLDTCNPKAEEINQVNNNKQSY